MHVRSTTLAQAVCCASLGELSPPSRVFPLRESPLRLRVTVCASDTSDTLLHLSALSSIAQPQHHAPRASTTTTFSVLIAASLPARVWTAAAHSRCAAARTAACSAAYIFIQFEPPQFCEARRERSALTLSLCSKAGGCEAMVSAWCMTSATSSLKAALTCTPLIAEASMKSMLWSFANSRAMSVLTHLRSGWSSLLPISSLTTCDEARGGARRHAEARGGGGKNRRVSTEGEQGRREARVCVARDGAMRNSAMRDSTVQRELCESAL